MAINATHILELVQRKIATANSSTSTADLDKLLTLAKQVDGSLIRSYDSDGALPDASLTNEKMAFITSTGNIKFNNGRWDTAGAAAAADAAPSWVFGGTVSGYASGGNPVANSNIIDKFSFAADGNATDVGDLTEGRYWGAGQSSATSGYTSGGRNPPVGYVNTIDKFSFAADGNATDVGDLTENRNNAAAGSSEISGYTSGGRNPALSPNTNTIDKFPFAADGNATDVGDLTEIKQGAAGQSSTVSGYSSGGTAPPSNNVIDKVSFCN